MSLIADWMPVAVAVGIFAVGLLYSRAHLRGEAGPLDPAAARGRGARGRGARMSRSRARPRTDPGIPAGDNAITDVPGVEVGYRTLIEDRGPVAVRTGSPRSCRAGGPRGGSGGRRGALLNGNGEMTGSVWIAESGSLGSPVLITNTHSVGAAHEGAIRWMLDAVPGRRTSGSCRSSRRPGTGGSTRSTGCTSGRDVGALEAARSGPVDEGRSAAARA
jgi:L-aminopeptidase/D-esterase-like protein